jgi:type I restriction enzyme S subunit
MNKVKFQTFANFKYGKIINEFLDEGYPVFSGYRITGYTENYMYDDEKLVVICRGIGGTGDVKISPPKSWITNLAIICDIDANVADYRYLYYYLGNQNSRMRELNTGSCQAQITIDQLKQFELYLPDLRTQKLVAEKLYNIDKKIEINNKICQELETLARTIYNYWFVQYDFPNEKGRPYKASGGNMVWVEQLNREIPEGWHVEKIGNYFEANRGLSYNSSQIEGDGIPMINLASFNIDGSYKHEGLKTYSGVYSDEKVLKPYDLIMCNTQQTAIDYEKDIIGKAMLVPDIFEGDIVSSHHVTTINVKYDELKFYLHRLFNTDYFHKYAAGYCNGTNILGLVFNGIENYLTEIPESRLLKKFAKRMLDIENRKNLIIRENQELAALRDWLLPLLMNGQVTFKE